MKRGGAKPESVHTMATRIATIKPRKLTDAHIEALREFDTLGSYPDSVVFGLRIFVGARKTT